MNIYIPQTKKELSQRKLEDYEKYCKVIVEGRRNPVWFAEWAYGIKLMDFQKYVFMSTWCAQFAAWLKCRGAGKSTLLDVYAMVRLDLIPNYKIWVSCNSAGQSAELFDGLESIALKRNPHFASITDVFAEEVVKTANSKSGFVRDPLGYKFKLYNDSGLVTLSTNLDAIRGKRGSIISDETLGLTRDRAAVIDLYGNVDTDFSLGVDEQALQEPKKFQLQMIYASSAGDVDTPWWDKYVLFSKRMILGDTNYFACDINANTVLHFTTVDGVPHKSHLTEEAIAKTMDEDPERGEREIYNKFRKGGGDDAVVKPDVLNRNSYVYPPVFCNDTGKRRFILLYDPARNFDNSILMVFEVLNDEESGYKIRLVNTISMVDTSTKKKTPLPMQEQLNILREAVVAYNGERAAEYENVVLYIDAGPGGGGIQAVGDFLVDEWQDAAGKMHRGMIDPVHEQYETLRKKYKDAAPIVRLVNPQGHKRIMYDAYEKLAALNLIEYPDYDGRDYLMIENSDGEIVEYQLSNKEMIALLQCNLAKNEVIYICKSVTDNGSVQYALSREKRNIMHDDRAYCFAMGAYALSIIRRDDKGRQEAEKIPDEPPSFVSSWDI